jgi:hypothetical protein
MVDTMSLRQWLMHTRRVANWGSGDEAPDAGATPVRRATVRRVAQRSGSAVAGPQPEEDSHSRTRCAYCGLTKGRHAYFCGTL